MAVWFKTCSKKISLTNVIIRQNISFQAPCNKKFLMIYDIFLLFLTIFEILIENVLIVNLSTLMKCCWLTSDIFYMRIMSSVIITFI
jgi:hypothetical protein